MTLNIDMMNRNFSSFPLLSTTHFKFIKLEQMLLWLQLYLRFISIVINYLMTKILGGGRIIILQKMRNAMKA